MKKVSTQRYIFCTAAFSDNHQCQENFVQQLIAMDFDNDKPGRKVRLKIKPITMIFTLCLRIIFYEAHLTNPNFVCQRQC